MPFIVQTNYGDAAGANAYLTVAEFKAYHDDRGQAYGSVTDSAIEQAIVKATSYLDGRFSFVGTKSYGRPQSTAWPRTNAVDVDGDTVFGVPQEVKNACAEYALRALTAPLAPDPLRDSSGATVVSRSETLGPLSESYTFAAGGSFRMPKYPAGDNWLRKSGLLEAGGETVRG